MTIGGALSELNNLLKVDDIPFYYKPSIKKVIETIEQDAIELRIGYWEWVQYDSNPNIGNWHCSKCRTIIPHMPEETDNTPIYKWCPMCGAKMSEIPTGEEGSEEE